MSNEKSFALFMRLSKTENDLLLSIDPDRARAIRLLISHYKASTFSSPFPLFINDFYDFAREAYAFLEALEKEKFIDASDLERSQHLRKQILALLSTVFEHY